LVHAFLDQPRLDLERGAVEVFSGEEEDHEVGCRLELRPVALGTQLLHVLAEAASVGGEVLATAALIRGCAGVEKPL